jgi:predicted dehydrogenase
MNVIHIGLGVRGRRWLEIVRGCPDMKSVGCVDPDVVALNWVRTHFPDHRHTCYEKLEEALGHVKADAGIIASSPALHTDQAIQALEAGLAILIEKPFAVSLAQARQVVEASRRAGRPVIVAQNYHDTRCEQTVRQLLHGGKVGTITHVSCVDRRLCPLPGNVPNQADCAQLLEVGAHHLDSLRRILGVNPVSVMARCSKAPWSTYQHGSTTEALLEMERNIHVQYHGSLTANRGEHTLWIEGERGVLWTDGSHLWWRKRGWRFFLPMRARKIPAVDAPKYTGEDMTICLNRLRAAVGEKQSPQAGGDDHLWTLATVEAVMLSDKTGKAVRIDDLFHAAGMTLPIPTQNTPGGSP